MPGPQYPMLVSVASARDFRQTGRAYVNSHRYILALDHHHALRPYLREESTRKMCDETTDGMCALW
jgi:hypothetical protein